MEERLIIGSVSTYVTFKVGGCHVVNCVTLTSFYLMRLLACSGTVNLWLQFEFLTAISKYCCCNLYSNILHSGVFGYKWECKTIERDTPIALQSTIGLLECYHFKCCVQSMNIVWRFINNLVSMKFGVNETRSFLFHS